MKSLLLLFNLGLASALTVQYDGQAYEACAGTSITVDKQGGNHNVYEGSSPSGTAVYSTLSTQNFDDTSGLLTASPGQTRTFYCSAHPTSTFSITCPAAEPSYVYVNTGTCESNGYETITDSTECETLALAYQYPATARAPGASTWKGVVNIADSTSQYASGCILTPDDTSHNYIYFNEAQTSYLCGQRTRDCLCREPISPAAPAAPTPTFKPADLDALEAATDACIATDATGAECYACLNGDIKTSAVACAAGDTAVFISDWDTSLVTSFKSLFQGKSDFNQPLNWDTSSVTTMRYMFYETAFNYDISRWDVSSVTDFQYMFFDVPEFKQDLSCWKVSSGNTASMFAYVGYPHTLCGWTVAQGTNMFAGAGSGSLDPTCTPTGCTKDGAASEPCTENEHVISGACTACDAGKVRAAGDDPEGGDTACTIPLFKPADHATLKAAIDACISTDATGAECYACFNGDIKTSAVACAAGDTAVFISDWDTSQVTSLGALFEGKIEFDQPLNWNTSKVTSFWHLFYGAKKFNQDISSWDTSQLTSLDYTFRGASAFNQCLCGWDTSSVTRMDYAFLGTTAFDQDISCWDVSSLTTATSIFSTSGLAHTLCWDTVVDIGKHYPGGVPTPYKDRTCTSSGCTAGACAENEHVSGGACTACAPGSGNPAGDDPAGGNTVCTLLPCAENEHVSGGACTACAPGSVNPAGDDPAGGNTVCGLYVLVGATECATLDAGTPCFCGSFGYDNLDVAGCQAHHTDIGSGSFQGADGSYSHATHAPYCTTRTSGSDYWWNTDFDSPTDCRDSRYNCVCIDTPAAPAAPAAAPAPAAPSAPAFKPANLAALKAATDACIATDATGAECYACLNGDIKTSAVACAAGDTAVFISDWDTSLVDSLFQLFKSKVNFDQDVGNWDTSSVTTLKETFYHADKYTNKGQPLNWDVSKVQDFRVAFAFTKFNTCICNWQLKEGTCLRSMFYDASEFDQDLSCFDWTKNTGVDIGQSVGYCNQYNFYQTSLSSDLCSSVSFNSNVFTDTTASADATCTSTGCTAPAAPAAPGGLPPCAENQHVSGGACKACAAGKVRPAGDKSDRGDTECTTLVCSQKEKIVSNECVACPAGKTGTGGDATGADTTCTATLCLENQRVLSNLCRDCASGKSSSAGADASGADTTCQEPVCNACPVPLDMKAVGVGTKVVCEDTSIQCVGEWVAYGGGCYHPTCTTLSCCSCAENERVWKNKCLPCRRGTVSAAGADPAGADTSCTKIARCLENQHVSSGQCEACPSGKHRAAGDQPPINSECWDASTCGGDVCVEANTVSCKDHACECKSGYGGSTCDKDITPSGVQKLIREARKNPFPTNADILQRQNTIKTFVKDTLKQKLKEGASVKDAISETKITVETQDLPQKAQALVAKSAKIPVIAVAPENKDEDDTCDEGFDTPGCAMVDLSSNTEEIVILTTDPAPGSWSILSAGSAIVSKQTRVSEFVYAMQCWDDGWGDEEIVDTTGGAELYECNSNVVLIGSQAGICTPNTCVHGNCTVDGTTYVCSCDAGYTGDNCELTAPSSMCYDFDCSNYGGHKTLGHCGGACTASICCNYGSISAFDTHCGTLSAAADYVEARCCHRSICLDGVSILTGS